MSIPFTATHGQDLAFIHPFYDLACRAPAVSDRLGFFRVTLPMAV